MTTTRTRAADRLSTGVRLLAWAPLAAVTALVVLVNAAAWATGTFVVVGLLTVVVAPPALLALLTTGLAGSMARTRRGADRWTLAGAVVVAGCGLLVAATGALWLLSGGDPAGRVLGLGVVAAGALTAATPMVVRKAQRHLS